MTTEVYDKLVRRTCYTGSWYEARPQLLEEQLNSFFQKATPIIESLQKPNPSRVLALVVPHAGYCFSGEAAAAAYLAVREQQVKRIFLLGPSHYVPFHGVGLPVASAFETPFGNLALDQEVLDVLKKRPLFSEQVEAHRREHSLEMQLPFIKKLWSDATLMPLLVGHLSLTEMEAVAQELQRLLQLGDLIVVSSDFTHYGRRFGYIPFQDNICEQIMQLNRAAYHYLTKLDGKGLLAFQQQTGDTICGIFPLVLLLMMLPGDAVASLKKYYTSQDKMPSGSGESVSYLAVTFNI